MATQIFTNSGADNSAEHIGPEARDRIERMRVRYQTGPAYISAERARYYTESWRSTEGRGMPAEIRVALAMKNVYEKMTHYLDDDDRVAGYWCEHFLGIPIDIERGVFNAVLEAELDKKSMLKFRAGTMARGLAYMVRKRMLGEFVENQKMARESGTPPLNMELKTMAEREINPYQITDRDKRELLGELLPYWRGKTTVDHIEKELMASGLFSEDMRDFVLSIPGNTSKQVFMISSCATIASYHAHIILDYDAVLGKGLVAMKSDITERLADESLVQEKRDFLKSVEIALDGIMIYARRLADRIEQELLSTTEEDKRERLERLLRVCRKAPLGPAETFEEALQAMWTVKTAVETAHPVYLHCFGRVDQILQPYYEKDIALGRIGRGRAVELCSELLLKIMSQNIRPESNILGNFYHRYLGSSPITLSGMTPEGQDATNDMTYVFLEAAHESKAVTNISVRVHEDSPDEVLLAVAEYLRQGTSNISLFADEMNVKAMVRRGFTETDARDYAVMGCVETTCPGKTGPMSANALQLSQLIDIVLRNGDSRLLAGTIKGDGLRTGEPESFKTFDDFLEALYKQSAYFIGKIAAGSNIRDKVFAERLPAPYLSAFTDNCVDSGKDVTRGGAKYIFAGVSMINSIANMIDSLLVIKELVFERKATTLRELTAAADNNYNGYEDIYREIQAIEGKWGNGDPETDALARRVMKRLFDMTYDHRTWLDGPFVVYVVSMITHTVDGRLSVASPDGRRAATPYAASCNPYNVEKCGVTASLRSIASLPFEDVMGAAVNMKFHPTAIGETEAARRKWASLIKTYFKIGGTQLQPTVASAEMLRDARDNPDQYRDLIVKVGGYSTYFTELGHEIQEEIIARTEHMC